MANVGWAVINQQAERATRQLSSASSSTRRKSTRMGRCGSTVPVSCLGTRRGAASAVPVSCLGTRGNNAVVRLCEEERDDDMCHPWHVLTRWLVAGRPYAPSKIAAATLMPHPPGRGMRCSANTSAPGMVGMVRHLLLAPLPLLRCCRLRHCTRYVTSRRTGMEVKHGEGTVRGKQ